MCGVENTIFSTFQLLRALETLLLRRKYLTIRGVAGGVILMSSVVYSDILAHISNTGADVGDIFYF